MKKGLKTIAMMLIIVMLVNCFTGCANQAFEKIIVMPFKVFGVILVGGMIVGAAVGLIVGIVKANAIKKRGPRRTNPYLYENGKFNTTIKSLPKEELDTMTQTINSLPDKELNLFTGRLNSLSREETVSLMDSLNSYSEQEVSVMVKTFNSMSETEKTASIKQLNALPETVSLADILQRDINTSGEKAYEWQSLQYGQNNY